MKVDPFTLKRLSHFAERFRQNAGQFPTLKDFEKAGFSKEQLDGAVRGGALVEWYVTLTSGATVKGYKPKT